MGPDPDPVSESAPGSTREASSNVPAAKPACPHNTARTQTVDVRRNLENPEACMPASLERAFRALFRFLLRVCASGCLGSRQPGNEGFCRGGPAWPPWAGVSGRGFPPPQGGHTGPPLGRVWFPCLCRLFAALFLSEMEVAFPLPRYQHQGGASWQSISSP